MPDQVHSPIGGSKVGRILQCSGSLKAEENSPQTSSYFADEGTAAHELLHHCYDVGLDPQDFMGRSITANDRSIVVDQEMVDAVQTGIDTYNDLLGEDSDGVVYLETNLDYSELLGLPANTAKGTPDALIYLKKSKELIVADFKYGKGVKVEVDHNPQLMTYAVGGAHVFKLLDEVKQYRMCIIQPRINHIAESTFTPAEADRFIKDVKHAVWKAYNAPEFHIGSYCKFCSAAATCPAIKDDLVRHFDALPEPNKDDDGDILGENLEIADIASHWAARVKEAAMQRLSNGNPVAGYKLVEGRQGNRQWRSEDSVTSLLRSMQLETEQMYDMKLASPTRIEKLKKSGVLDDTQWAEVQDHITRSDPKPTMVPASDARPAMSFGATQSDFEVLNER
jgi:hypothetical protein